jgi:hypothetical protein
MSPRKYALGLTSLMRGSAAAARDVTRPCSRADCWPSAVRSPGFYDRDGWTRQYRGKTDSVSFVCNGRSSGLTERQMIGSWPARFVSPVARRGLQPQVAGT